MSNLPPQELAYQQAHIHEDRGPIVIGVCASLFILSTSAVILRVVARRRKKVKLAWDDYSIFLAEVSHTVKCTLGMKDDERFTVSSYRADNRGHCE